MQNNWNFSICISLLLDILNVSSNKLAKSINVDPSLISRWKTGKRKISDESSHLKLIADYLSDKIINDYQKTRIMNIASKFNLPIDAGYSSSMREYMYILMASSMQGSSCSMNDESSYLQQCSFCNNEHVSSFEVITGHSNVMNAGINLLKQLSKKPDWITETILITFLTESDSFSNFEDTCHEWQEALMEAQNKGWNINKLMNINENINRNMKIINELLPSMMSEKYHPYYLNKYDCIMKLREFIIIPSVGTLACLCSENASKIDSAFLIRDEQASKVLTSAFDLCVNHTKPLITNRFAAQNTSLLTEIGNYDELNGDRLTYNFCLNNATIPVELIDKFLCLDKERMSQEEISRRRCQYERMKNNFHMQIRNHKFLDIYSKQFVENLIKASKNPLTLIETSDVLKLFQNIVSMLKKYDNYDVGLLNNANAEPLSNFAWMVKDSNVVLTNHVDANIKDCSKSYVSISEPNIANAFKKHFDELWSEIASVNKEKESVISWFETQIKGLINM